MKWKTAVAALAFCLPAVGQAQEIADENLAPYAQLVDKQCKYFSKKFEDLSLERQNGRSDVIILEVYSGDIEKGFKRELLQQMKNGTIRVSRSQVYLLNLMSEQPYKKVGVMLTERPKYTYSTTQAQEALAFGKIAYEECIEALEGKEVQVDQQTEKDLQELD